MSPYSRHGMLSVPHNSMFLGLEEVEDLAEGKARLGRLGREGRVWGMVGVVIGYLCCLSPLLVGISICDCLPIYTPLLPGHDMPSPPAHRACILPHPGIVHSHLLSSLYHSPPLILYISNQWMNFSRLPIPVWPLPWWWPDLDVYSHACLAVQWRGRVTYSPSFH